MNDRLEKHLLILAGVFLFLYSLILMLSPAVRDQSWDVAYRLSHWIGFLAWLIVVFFTHRILSHKLPDRDPYLLPFGSLLSGWGLLTIWRLEPSLGIRQTLWLVVGFVSFLGILYIKGDLNYLRRYKYVLLSSALILTSLTLFLGTNPAGFGPRLWLGFGGFYLQPSEPLKLLVVVYLSAYLADHTSIQLRVFPLLLPTLFATGLALLLLIIQRDLGTASIFILLYSVVLYIATNKRRVLLSTTIALFLAGLTGFFFIDIIHARLEAWINPWNDPSGRSYQIIQSLIAIANGGIFGRGPGLGSPSLVPVAHSDFIFTAVAEETGLIGTIALLAIFGLIFGRGIIISLRATNKFHRFLAVGITSYLGVQTLLIIGGNIRFLPLTGVTLPFVSYGGSSLLTSFIALGILIIISNKADKEPVVLKSLRPYNSLALILGIGLIAVSLINLWWSVIRAPDLLVRTDNPRRSISDRYVKRGTLLDRNNRPIDITEGKIGNYQRIYLFPQLASVVGYTHPVFGQAGLESSLDDYLRGLQGNPTSVILWDQLLYGNPPPGIDIRLSLDLDLQDFADKLTGNNTGAVILLNARSGEILVLASHPTFDPNKLNEIGSSLTKDKYSPLINRAVQGMYPPGTALDPFLKTFNNMNAITEEDLTNLYSKLGFFTIPQIRMQEGNSISNKNINGLLISPLQMAVAAASFSNNGIRPAPRIALSAKTSQQGWVVLPALDSPSEIFSPVISNKIAYQLSAPNQSFWEWTGSAYSNQKFSTWFLAGTLPNWQGTPLALVVLIEGDKKLQAQNLGRQLLQSSIKP
jgi:cell division protein FtsW (lipid II flippase)